jgi:hypothetical protein
MDVLRKRIEVPGACNLRGPKRVKDFCTSRAIPVQLLEPLASKVSGEFGQQTQSIR